jgi:hypothetical protein
MTQHSAAKSLNRPPQSGNAVLILRLAMAAAVAEAEPFAPVPDGLR